MRVGRKSPLLPLVAGAVCGVLLAVPHAAKAAHPVPSSEVATLHEWAGLTGTSPGTGAVDLEATLRNGVTRGWINVAVRNYLAGEYTLSAVTVSSASTVVLGDFNVKYVMGTRGRATTGLAYFGGTGSPFPSGFTPFDVASVFVSDSNGNVVSTGTLSPAPDGYYTAISPLTSILSQATGYALIRAGGCPPVVSWPVVTNNNSGDGGNDDGAAGTITLPPGNGGGTLTLAGASTYTGVTTVTGGTLTVGGLSNGGSSGGTVIVSGSLDSGGVITVGGATFTLGGSGIVLYSLPVYPGGATLTTAGGTTSTGTVGLSGSSPPVISGSLTLTGGTLTLGSGGNPPGGGLTIITSGTLTLDGSTGGITTAMLGAKTTTPVSFGKTKAAVKPASTPTPVTGELVIHAKGLPAGASVTYFADDTDIGTATTDATGNLAVCAIQGGKDGTLPDTLDLYLIQTVTVEDAGGNVLLSAGF